MAELQDMILTNEELNLPEVEETVAEIATVEEAPAAAPVQKKERSAKYKQSRSLVDRTHTYPVQDGVELVQRTSYSKFDGTITLHLNLRRDLKPTEVELPYSTGKSIRVAIVDDAVIADIEAGNLNFDVLLATPDTMKKLVSFARVLGPKGLMPNPKNGTLTSDPEAKKAQLEKGKIVLRSEKKAPLLHERVGKVSQPAAEVAANVQAIIDAVKPQSILKATVAATMSPGIKVVVASEK